jgi:hypothetical protein
VIRSHLVTELVADDANNARTSQRESRSDNRCASSLVGFPTRHAEIGPALGTRSTLSAQDVADVIVADANLSVQKSSRLLDHGSRTAIGKRVGFGCVNHVRVIPYENKPDSELSRHRAG